MFPGTRISGISSRAHRLESCSRAKLSGRRLPLKKVRKIVEVIEFKSTLRFDLRSKQINKKLEFVIAKTIAAFMNSSGGNLFIGVDDNQNILGLVDDISSLSKSNIDGFELHLVEIIKKYIGAGLSSHINITFPILEDAQICHIKVSRNSSPVFTQFEGKEDFYIRSGCSSQPLGREDQRTYEKSHWSTN